MHSTRSEFLQAYSTRTFAPTKKPSLTKAAAVYGKYYVLTLAYFSLCLLSIVMEFVDNGDLFQKIS